MKNMMRGIYPPSGLYFASAGSSASRRARVIHGRRRRAVAGSHSAPTTLGIYVCSLCVYTGGGGGGRWLGVAARTVVVHVDHDKVVGEILHALLPSEGRTEALAGATPRLVDHDHCELVALLSCRQALVDLHPFHFVTKPCAKCSVSSVTQGQPRNQAQSTHRVRGRWPQPRQRGRRQTRGRRRAWLC